MNFYDVMFWSSCAKVVNKIPQPNINLNLTKPTEDKDKKHFSCQMYVYECEWLDAQSNFSFFLQLKNDSIITPSLSSETADIVRLQCDTMSLATLYLWLMRRRGSLVVVKRKDKNTKYMDSFLKGTNRTKLGTEGLVSLQVSECIFPWNFKANSEMKTAWYLSALRKVKNPFVLVWVWERDFFFCWKTLTSTLLGEGLYISIQFNTIFFGLATRLFSTIKNRNPWWCWCDIRLLFSPYSYSKSNVSIYFH